MSEVILPYDPDPLIKTYPYLSFYLGILSGNQIEIQNLLINEFMHIFFFRGSLDFTASGYFERKRFGYQYIKKKDRTVDVFKAAIREGQYVIAVLNEHYIPNATIYRSYDFYHDWLLFGYSDATSCFTCAGYSGIEHSFRTYGVEEIRYEDIQRSLSHTGWSYFTGTRKDTHLSWIRSNYTENSPNDTMIKRELSRYMHPRKIRIYHRPVIHIDMDAIRCFIKYLKQFESQWLQNPKSRLFIKSFRIFYEHKKVLQTAVLQITDQKNILREYNSIVESSLSLFILAAKFNMHPSADSIHYIIYLLEKITAQEMQLFQTLLD